MGGSAGGVVGGSVVGDDGGDVVGCDGVAWDSAVVGADGEDGAGAAPSRIPIRLHGGAATGRPPTTRTARTLAASGPASAKAIRKRPCSTPPLASGLQRPASRDCSWTRPRPSREVTLPVARAAAPLVTSVGTESETRGVAMGGAATTPGTPASAPSPRHPISATSRRGAEGLTRSRYPDASVSAHRHCGSGGFGGELGRPLLDRDRVHPGDLPVVAVEVVEAALVHEAVVLRIFHGTGPGGRRGGEQRVDFLAARGADAGGQGGRLGGVGDRLGDEVG